MRFTIVVLSLALLGGCQRSDEEPRASERGLSGQHARPSDRVPNLDIAALDLPTDLPFVGPAGLDAHGYPLAQPDEAALLNLLRLRRFDELDRFITHYQAEFEADFRKEYWPELALSAFETAEPKIGELLDEWLARSPSSFAAHAARGNHRLRLAKDRRGGAFADKTSAEQFAAMNAALELADADFLEALKLRPKYVAVQARLLQTANFRGAVEQEQERLEQALALCPNCYIPRAKYLDAMTPRWGGSHEQMRAFASESASLIEQNPRLALLAGFVAWDQCRTATTAKRYAAAHEACDAALAFGEEGRFLAAAAELHFAEGNHSAALPVLDRLLAVLPFHGRGLELRYVARLELQDTLGAGRDLLALRHIDPAGAGRDERIEHMLGKLRHDGHQAHEAGKYVEAAEYFSLGLQLAPNDQDMMTREAMNQKKIGFAAAQAQLAAAPDDFALHLRVDHGLAASGRYADVVKIWDTFIAAHEDDPRPYAERAGAKWHLGRQGEAIADMDEACQRGLERACADVERMRARARK